MHVRNGVVILGTNRPALASVTRVFLTDVHTWDFVRVDRLPCSKGKAGGATAPGTATAPGGATAPGTATAPGGATVGSTTVPNTGTVGGAAAGAAAAGAVPGGTKASGVKYAFQRVRVTVVIQRFQGAKFGRRSGSAPEPIQVIISPSRSRKLISSIGYTTFPSACCARLEGVKGGWQWRGVVACRGVAAVTTTSVYPCTWLRLHFVNLMRVTPPPPHTHTHTHTRTPHTHVFLYIVDAVQARVRNHHGGAR